MIKYWFKISDGNNTNCILATVCTKLLNELENKPNCSNWLAHIKTVLNQSGFHDVWLYRASVNVILRQTLRDLYINEWREGITFHTSLSLYREFKTTFELATDLQKVESPKLSVFFFVCLKFDCHLII